MNKLSILLGLLTGIAISIIMLAPLPIHDFSNIGNESTGAFEMLLASIGGVAAMLITYRKHPDTKFTQLIKIGAFTGLIMVLVVYIADVIYFKWVNPEYISHYVDVLTQQRLAKLTDATKKAELIANMESNRSTYTNPFIYPIGVAFPMFFISLMPVAITGYVLFRLSSRKKVAK